MALRSTSVYRVLRRVGTAVITPLRFSIDTGHFKSSIARRALDSKGNPLPWYTYPAIEFLSTVDFTDYTILEFGGGQSTLWWAGRADYVFSVENDTTWFNYINPKVSKLRNVEFYLCSDLLEYAIKPLGKQFDLIIIDGGDRYLCAQTSLKVIKSEGAIVLDNSEGFWGGDHNGTYPIVELFQRSGFMRVDFYGYAPGVIRPHCTSIFFREQSKIFRGLRPPLRKGQ
jgi:hypothetical protein